MISIITPVFNAERFIAECIESVVEQSYQNWELILVDDGSTDSSADIIRSYLSDNRIKYIYKPNSGVTETRWIGVQHSKREIIMFLDADDMLVSGALNFVINNFDNNTDILVFGNQSFKNSSELSPIQNKSYKKSIFTDKILLCDSIMTGKILSCVTGGAYRRKIINNHQQIFCNNLRIGEDTMFNLQLASIESLRVDTFAIRPYGYRVNEDSVTRKINKQRFDAVKDVINYIDKYKNEHKEISDKIKGAIAFRILLLWSTFMFYSNNEYYQDKKMRKKMRKLYPIAFSKLYPYLRVYLFLDLYIGPWLSQMLIRK